MARGRKAGPARKRGIVWRLLRERAGWTPAQLAAKLDVTPQFVTGLEAGRKTNTTDAILERASELFRVSKDVLTWDGGPLPPALEKFLDDSGLRGRLDPVTLAALATFQRTIGRAPKPHEYGIFLNILQSQP